MSNLYRFNNIPYTNKSQDLLLKTYPSDIKKINKDLRLFNYKLVFNLKESFNYIKNNNLESNTYVLGTTYGFLPEIINGYTVKQIFKIKKIIDKQNNLKKTDKYSLAESVNKDENIKVILITDIKESKILIDKLIEKNWEYKKKFINKKYRSTIHMMVRK